MFFKSPVVLTGDFFCWVYPAKFTQMHVMRLHQIAVICADYQSDRWTFVLNCSCSGLLGTEHPPAVRHIKEVTK